MQSTPVYFSAEEMQKLLSTHSADTIALCIYLRSGNSLYAAQSDLQISDSALRTAKANLEELGLLQKASLSPLPKPSYGERDIILARSRNNGFQETSYMVQQLLGRTLGTEELKILLGITNYLGFTYDMVCILVSHCMEESRRRGYRSGPSMRYIEKEAYRWSDAGIETLENAQEYLAGIRQKESKIEQLKQIIQIHGRSLTPPEQRMAEKWLQLGISEELIRLAFEKTCMKTGGMNWPYMDKILMSWSTAGYKTVEDTKGRPGNKNSQPASRELDPDELEAIRRMVHSSTSGDETITK